MKRHPLILASSCARVVILADRLDPRIEAFAEEISRQLPVRGLLVDSVEGDGSQGERWLSLPAAAGRDRLLDVWEELGTERALIIDLSTFAGGLALPMDGPRVRLDPHAGGLSSALDGTLEDALEGEPDDDVGLLHRLRVEVARGPEAAAALAAPRSPTPALQRLRVAQSLGSWDLAAARGELERLANHGGGVSKRSTELLAGELDRRRMATLLRPVRRRLLGAARAAARRGWPGAWRLQRRLERPWRTAVPGDLQDRLQSEG